MFKFGNPEYLYLLIIIPIMIIGYILIRYNRRQKLKKFGDPALVMNLMPDYSALRQHIKFALITLAATSLIIAVARPQFGAKLETVKRLGVEVIVALDVSNSMMAEDIRPNRLEKSKQLLYKILEKLNNDKMGLIVFAGRAFTQLPITTDYYSSKMLISTVEPQMIKEQGTEIGTSIRMAMKSFTTAENVGRSIIVITDGEDHEQTAVEAAKEAAEKGIQVNVIGVGTPTGALIPTGVRNTFKMDKDGNPIKTRLNEAMCQEIAMAGNGIYVRATNTGNDIKIIQDEIAKLAKEDVDVKAYSEYDEAFPIFCWISVALLIVELLFLERKNKLFRNIKLFE